ncbi:hypothetical protein ACP4OV_012945 [Aristida adscensionis]
MHTRQQTVAITSIEAAGMASQLPPSFPFFAPPPPRRPPPRPWRPPTPTPTADDSSTSTAGVIAGVSFVVGALFLLVLSIMCKRCKDHPDRRATGGAGAAASAMGARPRTVVAPEPRHDDDDDADAPEGRPRRRDGNPAAGLPSFTYSRSVKHGVAGAAGEEASPPSCTVCLGAFQRGETVRLLPVCLHLYHVECIDPWLEKHSTCPLCRSGIDPTVDGGMLPPV